jgi:hypothetical protein
MLQDNEFCILCFCTNFSSVAVVDQMPAIFKFVYLLVIRYSDVAKEYFSSTWCVNLKDYHFMKFGFF